MKSFATGSTLAALFEEYRRCHPLAQPRLVFSRAILGPAAEKPERCGKCHEPTGDVSCVYCKRCLACCRCLPEVA